MASAPASSSGKKLRWRWTRSLTSSEGRRGLQDLGELDEDGRARRPAVVLDEVEVAGRAAQALRELDLAEALAAPQRRRLPAQLECFCHAGRLYTFTDLQRAIDTTVSA